MKRIAAVAFLLACLALHSRPASAAVEHFSISLPDRQSVTIDGVVHALPASPREGYFAVKGGGVAAMYLDPQGNPGIVDFGQSYMVADSFGCGFQCMTYDSSNNLDVNVKAGTITTTISGNVQVVDSTSKSALLSTANTCTTVVSGAHTLAKMINVSSTADGATQEIKIYDDTVCTNNANVVYDVVQVGAGQIFTLDVPMTTGISVQISNNGALSGLGVRVTFI